VENSYKRTRLWVNAGFQFQFMVRVALYLIVSILLVLHAAFGIELLWVRIVGVQREPFLEAYLGFLSTHRFILIGYSLFVPWVLFDILKFSHRIAGPLLRCRNMMLDMAAGKHVPEFQPRTNDLMPEFFEAFNQLIRKCNANLDAKGVESSEPLHRETHGDREPVLCDSNVG
jgi:hypothetical protein